MRHTKSSSEQTKVHTTFSSDDHVIHQEAMLCLEAKHRQSRLVYSVTKCKTASKAPIHASISMFIPRTCMPLSCRKASLFQNKSSFPRMSSPTQWEAFIPCSRQDPLQGSTAVPSCSCQNGSVSYLLYSIPHLEMNTPSAAGRRPREVKLFCPETVLLKGAKP